MAPTRPRRPGLLAKLALEAGMPPGVPNVLHGYGPGSADAALTSHPGVDRITFTGASATGKVIFAAAAAHLVPVSLELGSKGANLVRDDELDGAVDWPIRAICTTSGQVCLAGYGGTIVTGGLGAGWALAGWCGRPWSPMRRQPVPRAPGRRRAAGRPVWLDCFNPGSAKPFGGAVDSGVGREGGTFSREFFTEPKAVVMQI